MTLSEPVIRLKPWLRKIPADDSCNEFGTFHPQPPRFVVSSRPIWIPALLYGAGSWPWREAAKVSGAAREMTSWEILYDKDGVDKGKYPSRPSTSFTGNLD